MKNKEINFWHRPDDDCIGLPQCNQRKANAKPKGNLRKSIGKVGIPRIFHMSSIRFPYVFHMFSICFHDCSGLPQCNQRKANVRPKGNLRKSIGKVCIPWIFHMFSICFLYVFHMFSMCFPYVSCQFLSSPGHGSTPGNLFIYLFFYFFK